MANITYLLGAGASAHAIPIVEGFKKRIFEIRLLLFDYTKENRNESAYDSLPQKIKDKNDILKELITEFVWLMEQASHHQTIDTLAKKYYLTDHVSLIRLKKILIIFFTIEQLISMPDLRYDSFFASIFRKEGNNMYLSKNVKIISWNYDLQIELTLRNYVNLNIHGLKDFFQIHPNQKSFDLQEELPIDKDNFGVIKLNGNAFWNCGQTENNHSDNDYSESLLDRFPNRAKLEVFLGDLLEEYEKLFKPNIYPYYLKHFNFAWESDKDFHQKYAGYSVNINEAKSLAKKTDVLVIIGYSFPVFNREIDSIIMNEMKAVNKVYIQDLTPEKIKSTIENAFKLFQQSTSITYQLESNTSQFVIPYEL